MSPFALVGAAININSHTFSLGKKMLRRSATGAPTYLKGALTLCANSKTYAKWLSLSEMLAKLLSECLPA